MVKKKDKAGSGEIHHGWGYTGKPNANIAWDARFRLISLNDLKEYVEYFYGDNPTTELKKRSINFHPTLEGFIKWMETKDE